MKKIRQLLSKKLDNEVVFLPASSGASMSPFVHWISTYSTLSPKNVFEIGANMAQDAEALREGFGLEPRDVWVFEPHPGLYDFIKKEYNFNAFDLAVSNKNGKMTMNLIDPSMNSNSGISSLRVHRDVPQDNFKKSTVKTIRMETFIRDKEISSIDFLKLDVEGYNFEVLEGFGESIDLIQSLHVEAEHYDHWKGEKLWGDIRNFLEPHFELVFFERHFTQSDSFWIKKDYIKHNS